MAIAAPVLGLEPKSYNPIRSLKKDTWKLKLQVLSFIGKSIGERWRYPILSGLTLKILCDPLKVEIKEI